MKIVTIRETTLDMAEATRNAAVGFGRMTASVAVVEVETVAGHRVRGFAIDSPGRYASGAVLRERLAPRVLAADPAAYLDASGTLPDPWKIRALAMRDEKPGGHGERAAAMGLLDGAIWDLIGKLQDKPLWSVLRGPKPGVPSVPVYATCGFYRDEDDLPRLEDELERAIDLGFDTVKIKGGALDLDADRRRIDLALECLGGKAKLALDCNATMTLDEARAFLGIIADLPIAWVEEPVDPLDYDAHRALAAEFAVPLGTGENLFSAADARNLLRHGGLRPDRDLLQFDIGLGHGLVEYLRIVAEAEEAGWTREHFVPHVGYRFALQVAAGLGLGRHEVGPFQRIAYRPAMIGAGASPGDAPGIGWEADPVFADLFAVLDR
jgi:L-alanine-DL-glutamate epimerase-like enolase superfamily enzyme